MAATRISTKGQVVIPKEVREQAGARPGREYDVVVEGEVIKLTPKRSRLDALPRLTIAEFLARRIPVAGASISDERIRDAAIERAIERFERSSGR
jgi:AbrB family looped-hinge helix DNA binding protein